MLETIPLRSLKSEATFDDDVILRRSGSSRNLSSNRSSRDRSSHSKPKSAATTANRHSLFAPLTGATKLGSSLRSLSPFRHRGERSRRSSFTEHVSSSSSSSENDGGTGEQESYQQQQHSSEHESGGGGGDHHHRQTSSSGGITVQHKPSYSISGSIVSQPASNSSNNNNNSQQRPPAIRSNSSSSSLFTVGSSGGSPGRDVDHYQQQNQQYQNHHQHYPQQQQQQQQKELRISSAAGDQRAYHRPRRGAMVSCENLLSESSELFGGVPENSGQHNLLSSSLKSSTKSAGSGGGSNSSSNRKMYRSGGGIFSNPFKSDSEKMDLLTDLLKQYRESGIPETGGGGKHHHHLLHSQSHCQSTNKLNHLRASSLSIGGFTGSSTANQSAVSPTSAVANASNSNNSSANNSPSSSLLASSTHQKVTSLSTTDLHHLNHSLSLTGSPQSQHHQQQQTSSSFDASDDAGSSYLYLEPEWGSIVEGAEQLPGRVKAQNEAIWELLTTEVFYIRRLKVVNDIFVACLLNLQSECILNEIDAKNVFSNIGQVFEANHHFWMNHLLPMLNYSRETKSPLNPAMFEEGFLQFDQIFQPYIQYCLEQSTCLQYIKEKKKTNVLFKTYVLWCENHKDCERLRLIDLLVMPWQRLTKYSLLIKAILKKTDNEMHREALKRMDLCVDRFVTNVNGAMFRQQEHERLSTVVSRIDSYDAIDCNHDEAEKLIKDYLYLDLLQGMPGCSSSQIRHLYLEDSLKLKDAQSNKVDVHCFLFTDVFLVCKSLSKKASGSECKVKVVRQPFVTDRLVVRELKDGSGFLMIYLNELQVASAFLLLYTADTRTWVEGIRRAQEDYRNLKYSSEQEASMYALSGGGGGGGGGYQTHSYDQDDAGSSFDAGSTTSGLIMGGSGGGGGRLHHLGAGGGGGGGGGGGISPRSSSRSSLVHSHSGSQEMAIATDQQQQLVVGSAPTTHQSYCISSGNQLTINQAGSGGQPPRAVSFELGDLRNPSLVVEDADAFARSQSVETRSPVAVTITSPRPERRAFLLRSTGGGSGSGGNGSGSSGGGNEGNGGTGNQRNSSGSSSPLNGSVTYLSQNSLSVSVPSQQQQQQQQQQANLQPHPMPRSGRRSAIAAAAAAAAAAANNSSSAEAPNYHPQSQLQPQPQQQHLSSIQVAVTAPPPSPPPPPTSASSASPQKRQSPPPPSSQVIVSRSSPTSSSSTTTTPTPPPPPPPPPSPPSLMSISSRGQPNSPLTMTINKPPLVKTKNVSCGVASLTSYPGTGQQQQEQQQQVQCETVNVEGGEGGGEHQQHHHQHHQHHPRPPSRSFEHQTGGSDSQTDDGGSGSEEYLKNSCKAYGQQQQQQPKRTCRPDRRYHTADSIEHMKKEKDNSIHKRLSWNYGQGQQQQQQHCGCSHHHQLLHHSGGLVSGASSSGFGGQSGQQQQPRSLQLSSGTCCGNSGSGLSSHPKDCAQHCLSCESVYSSSGFSSTGSVALSVGSAEGGNGSGGGNNNNNNNLACCDPSCSCCCGGAPSTGLQNQQEHFDEEEEYEQQQQQLHHSSAECLVASSSSLSDRDSALPNSPAMCFHAKTDSQCSVDSTASCGGDAGHRRESLVRSGSGVLQTSTSPSITSVNTSDIKIDVSEVKDGISSVQITLGSGNGSGSASPTAATSSSSSNPVVTRPSKADLKKMKEFLLSNCNVESSEV